MSCCVKWENVTSRSFPVPLGIKQGGINSPDFFACYFDGLTKLLREEAIGCHVKKLFLAVILFADDICLIAPTRSGLNKMIENCSFYCRRFGLSFNPIKSKVMIFSKRKLNTSLFAPIYLNGQSVEYVNSIKYLGTTIISDPNFEFSARNDLVSFYRATNSILNVLHKPSEEVAMQLLYTNCVPILTYASAVKIFSAKEMTSCTVALNDAIRKIVSFNRWESVRSLRESFGYKSLYEIFAAASKKFRDALPSHRNSTIKCLANIVFTQ